MSDETTPGPDLREQIADILEDAFPEAYGILAVTAAITAVVQPVIDRLTERIPYREGETEEQYLERQVARWRSEAWQARGKLREAKTERDQALVDLETAKGWRDAALTERDAARTEAAEYRLANTRLQELITLRTEERDQLKAGRLSEAMAARKNIRRWAGQVKEAEAERDRLDVRMEEIVEGFKNAHNCHRADQSGILCATCHTRYPCPTARALDAIGDQASDVVAERDQLKATVARVKALAEDMRTWCSPYGIADHYAQRIEEAIEPPEPVGIEADSEAEFAAKLGTILRKHRAEVHPEHNHACANCAVIKGAPEVLTAGLGDLPAVRAFVAGFDPRGESK